MFLCFPYKRARFNSLLHPANLDALMIPFAGKGNRMNESCLPLPMTFLRNFSIRKQNLKKSYSSVVRCVFGL